MPDSTGLYSDFDWSKSEVKAYYPQLIVHELTHIAQFRHYIDLGLSLQKLWEIEGGASLAEQLGGYSRFGGGSGQDMDIANLFNSAEGAWYRNAWIGDLVFYFGYANEDPRFDEAPEECQWIGSQEGAQKDPCWGSPAYGVGATVFRYMLDRYGPGYGGGEANLMTDWTTTTGTGFAKLDAANNASLFPLGTRGFLADFYTALYIDMWGGKDPGMATWDLNAVLPRNTKLVVDQSTDAEPTLTGRSIRGGSNLYLNWVPGQHQPTSIRVTGAGGTALPAEMAVWVTRLAGKPGSQ